MAADAVIPKRRRRRRPNQAGFTLVEVMIAVLLTAIATGGIIGLYTVQTRSSGFSRHTTEATVLAQDQLERLRTYAPAPYALTEPGLDALGNTGGVFTRVSAVTLDTSTLYYTMNVTVGWTEDGVAKTVLVRARRNAQ